MKHTNDINEATRLILNLMQSTIGYNGGFIVKDQDFEPDGFMRLEFRDKDFKMYNATTIINGRTKNSTAEQIINAIIRDARCFI